MNIISPTHPYSILSSDLVAANAYELLHGTDTPSGQFGEEDHAVDVVCRGQYGVLEYDVWGVTYYTLGA